MMRGLNINLRVTIDRASLLEKLIANRERHGVMFTEAVVGFKDHAASKLSKVLERCTGKEDVYLHLSAPTDNTSAYTTVIEMLQDHKGETIEMSASEYRMLAQDKWDWTDEWLTSNSVYSSTATRVLNGED